MVSIRSTQPGDAATINNLLETNYPTDIQTPSENTSRDNKPLSVSLVAINKDEIVGYIAFSPAETDKEVYLYQLAILPTYQHNGVGSQLVCAGLDACIQNGFEFIADTK